MSFIADCPRQKRLRVSDVLSRTASPCACVPNGKIAAVLFAFPPQMGGHGMFAGGGGGGGMPPPRGMHQPGMHPVNPSQGLRAQVPHQFLSAQVCGSHSLPVLFDEPINTV